MSITYTAFAGHAQIARGALAAVAQLCFQARRMDPRADIRLFGDADGRPVELDLRGTARQVERRVRALEKVRTGEDDAPRPPGRPRLGVVAREVTLLPAHWDWLARQPGGASVALRTLVEAASRDDDGRARLRAKEAAARFMTAMGADLPGLEGALRALAAGDSESFDAHLAGWPEHPRRHAQRLAEPVFLL